MSAILSKRASRALWLLISKSASYNAAMRSWTLRFAPGLALPQPSSSSTPTQGLSTSPSNPSVDANAFTTTAFSFDRISRPKSLVTPSGFNTIVLHITASSARTTRVIPSPRRSKRRASDAASLVVAATTSNPFSHANARTRSGTASSTLLSRLHASYTRIFTSTSPMSSPNASVEDRFNSTSRENSSSSSPPPLVSTTALTPYARAVKSSTAMPSTATPRASPTHIATSLTL
mmetsp:Transcript_5744/g.20791  ORF Transcript_5744/g.20791 Transcript_5744/m.20791 type:complete len:233 (-) Transcript_5744:186-884(-)